MSPRSFIACRAKALRLASLACLCALAAVICSAIGAIPTTPGIGWAPTTLTRMIPMRANAKRTRSSSDCSDYRRSGRACARVSCDNVIFTGGEPLLQQRILALVAHALRSTRTEYEFEVETNGTIKPIYDFDTIITRYNVSPKLSNSRMGLDDRLRVRAEVVRG